MDRIREIGEEIWRDIPNYENYYQCSNWGRIKGLERYIKTGKSYGVHLLKEKILKLQINNKGRFVVTLSKNENIKQYFISRLVLETFVGPCPEGMECCHEDGNKLNNNLSNLYWGTHIENMKDKIKHGTICSGEKSWNHKLTWEKVEEIREKYIPRIYSGLKLAKEYGVSKPNIYNIIYNKIWVI